MTPPQIPDNPVRPGDDGAAAVSVSTRKSYDKGFTVFQRYCDSVHEPSVPAGAALVCQFIGAASAGVLRRPGKGRHEKGEQAPLAPSTLEVILCAIGFKHEQAGHVSPVRDAAVTAAR